MAYDRDDIAVLSKLYTRYSESVRRGRWFSSSSAGVPELTLERLVSIGLMEKKTDIGKPVYSWSSVGLAEIKAMPSRRPKTDTRK